MTPSEKASIKQTARAAVEEAMKSFDPGKINKKLLRLAKAVAGLTAKVENMEKAAAEKVEPVKEDQPKKAAKPAPEPKANKKAAK